MADAPEGTTAPRQGWRKVIDYIACNCVECNIEAQEGEAVIESIDYELIPLSRARTLSKRMYYGGFFFLPLMWAMNVWLFWPDCWSRGGDPVIKRWTRYSAICCMVATAIFLPWLLLYAIAGQSVLSPNVYNALDAASLDLSAYGLGIINPNK